MTCVSNGEHQPEDWTWMQLFIVLVVHIRLQDGIIHSYPDGRGHRGKPHLPVTTQFGVKCVAQGHVGMGWTRWTLSHSRPLIVTVIDGLRGVHMLYDFGQMRAHLNKNSQL